jgi:predicted regulator of Ras-like GTPase activity (Roadblock/LC7/MglB family)
MQTQEIHHSARNQLQGEPLVSTRSAFGEPTMNTNQIESILKQLVAKPIGIQEAALVSAEGQAIVVPIGIDENTAGILAGTMISLLKVTQEELYWQTIETVSVRSPEGHLILKSCGTDTYLLIKSGKVPVGLLEGEVSRAVDKLRVELEVNQNVAPPALLEPSPATLTLPEAPNNLLEDASAPPSLNSIDSSDNEVTYRGRRTSS